MFPISCLKHSLVFINYFYNFYYYFSPESIRNIVRDVWDIRVGKLLSSVNGFLSSGSSTARVSQLTNMELTTLHNLLANSMDQLSLLRQATSQAVEFGGSAVNRTSFLNSSSVGN